MAKNPPTRHRANVFASHDATLLEIFIRFHGRCKTEKNLDGVAVGDLPPSGREFDVMYCGRLLRFSIRAFLADSSDFAMLYVHEVVGPEEKKLKFVYQVKCDTDGNLIDFDIDLPKSTHGSLHSALDGEIGAPNVLLFALISAVTSD